MRKNDFRLFFANCKLYLKLSYFCELEGISPQNLSHFIKGYDGALCYDSLSRLYKRIIQELEKIV